MTLTNTLPQLQESREMSALERAVIKTISRTPASSLAVGFDLALGCARYEALRRLNAQEFSTLCERNLKGERFDDMVDELVVGREIR